ncbi:MAG: MBL fold metallo-hydrolase [Bacteroidota bacterium]
MQNELHRIEIPLGIMFQTVNCYLISGAQLTLIDCGLYTANNWNLFQEKIKALGYRVSDIEQVIITHEHRDHTGLLPEIMDNSDAIVRAPKAIKGWFFRPDEMKEREGRFNRTLFRTIGFPEAKKVLLDQFYKSVKLGRKINDRSRFSFFEEGDKLKIGNTDWEVLNTPGHCPNQHVFLQKAQRRIFGSDMLLPLAPMPIISEHPDKPGEPTKSLNDLIASFARLKVFEIATVYPGHGAVFQQANQMIDKQLARIKMRKQECFEAIREGFVTPYQINRKMYPYQQIPPDFSGLFMILGYLDLLEEEGKITRRYDEEGVVHFRVDG